MKIDKGTLAGIFDSTLLREGITGEEIAKLCKNAISQNFFAVCVPPEFVRHAYEHVKDSPVRVVSVVSFPSGADPTLVKCSQAEKIVKDGADEIDMVMNIKRFLAGKYNEVYEDILNTVIAAKSTNSRRFLVDVTVVKVIIETSQLRMSEIESGHTEGFLIQKASEIAAKAQVDFVKTSTGLHKAGGVRVTDVSLIKQVIPESVKVKAAGGVKTLKQVIELMEEGVDRIGTSSAGQIMSELEK